MVKDLAANPPGPWLDMQGRQVDRFVRVQRDRPAEDQGGRSVAQRMVRMSFQGRPRSQRVLSADPFPTFLIRVVGARLSVDTGLNADDRLATNQRRNT